jgi:hypothetical protein
MTETRMKLHGEVALNVVSREVGEIVGAALHREFAAHGCQARSQGDRLVFDAYPTGATPRGDALRLLTNAVYGAFEKRGVHWTELSWSPWTCEVAELHSEESPDVQGRQKRLRGRLDLHLVKG